MKKQIFLISLIDSILSVIIYCAVFPDSFLVTYVFAGAVILSSVLFILISKFRMLFLSVKDIIKSSGLYISFYLALMILFSVIDIIFKISKALNFDMANGASLIAFCYINAIFFGVSLLIKVVVMIAKYKLSKK